MNDLSPGVEQYAGTASGINASGEVVGWWAFDVPPYGAAKIWLPSPAYGLPAGLGSLSPLNLAEAVNDMGQVVG